MTIKSRPYQPTNLIVTHQIGARHWPVLLLYERSGANVLQTGERQTSESECTAGRRVRPDRTLFGRPAAHASHRDQDATGERPVRLFERQKGVQQHSASGGHSWLVHRCDSDLDARCTVQQYLLRILQPVTQAYGGEPTGAVSADQSNAAAQSISEQFYVRCDGGFRGEHLHTAA